MWITVSVIERYIFGFLGRRDRFIQRRVCKGWKSATEKDNAYWNQYLEEAQSTSKRHMILWLYNDERQIILYFAAASYRQTSAEAIAVINAVEKWDEEFYVFPRSWYMQFLRTRDHIDPQQDLYPENAIASVRRRRRTVATDTAARPWTPFEKHRITALLRRDMCFKDRITTNTSGCWMNAGHTCGSGCTLSTVSSAWSFRFEDDVHGTFTDMVGTTDFLPGGRSDVIRYGLRCPPNTKPDTLSCLPGVNPDALSGLLRQSEGAVIVFVLGRCGRLSHSPAWASLITAAFESAEHGRLNLSRIFRTMLDLYPDDVVVRLVSTYMAQMVSWALMTPSSLPSDLDRIIGLFLVSIWNVPTDHPALLFLRSYRELTGRPAGPDVMLHFPIIRDIVGAWDDTQTTVAADLALMIPLIRLAKLPDEFHAMAFVKYIDRVFKEMPNEQWTIFRRAQGMVLSLSWPLPCFLIRPSLSGDKIMRFLDEYDRAPPTIGTLPEVGLICRSQANIIEMGWDRATTYAMRCPRLRAAGLFSTHHLFHMPIEGMRLLEAIIAEFTSLDEIWTIVKTWATPVSVEGHSLPVVTVGDALHCLWNSVRLPMRPLPVGVTAALFKDTTIMWYMESVVDEKGVHMNLHEKECAFPEAVMRHKPVVAKKPSGFASIDDVMSYIDRYHRFGVADV